MKSIQLKIAQSSEELMQISRAVSDILDMCQKQEDLMFIKLQCNFQKKRLQELERQLLECQLVLQGVQGKESLKISENLLCQNLALIQNNICIINSIFSEK